MLNLHEDSLIKEIVYEFVLESCFFKHLLLVLNIHVNALITC